MIGKKLVMGMLMVLMINIVYAEIQWGNPTSSGVTTASNLPVCKSEGNGVKYWEKVIGGLVDKTYSIDDCYRDNGVDVLLVPNTKCCPANKPLCKQVGTSAVWKCESSAISIMSCEDYSTADCENSNDIARTQLTNSNVFTGTKFGCSYSGAVGTCTEYVDCICSVQNGVCKPNAKLIIWNSDEGKMYTKGINEVVNYSTMCSATVSTGDCAISIATVDNCNSTNTKGVSWTVSWTGAGDAPDYCKCDASHPCEKEVQCAAQLDFVRLSSIILAIVLIIVFYIIIFRKKKAIKSKKAKVRKKKRR